MRINKAFTMVLILLASSATAPVLLGKDGRRCRLNGEEIKFTTSAQFDAYKKEYFNNQWASEEAPKEKEGTYPIYSLQISPTGLRVWGYASEFTKASLKQTDKSGRFLMAGIWQRWGSSGVREKFRQSFEKYSDSSVDYYLELNDFCNCRGNPDLVVDVFRNGAQVERISFRAKR